MFSNIKYFIGFNLLIIGMLFSFPQGLTAHCDKVDGPVATAAIQALETGEFQTIQIWVSQMQETELRRVYDQVRAVRSDGEEVQEVVDRYFIETAVRLHRESEGMPYTGVKPANSPNPRDIVAGDRALANEDINEILSLLTTALEEETTRWYSQAVEAKSHRDESVEAGRDWVDAYVKYIVYVHSLYQKIQAGPAHGVGAED